MRECIKQDWFIALGGVVTFKNGKKLQEVVKNCDLKDIILETDCPYLAPVPYRGKRNSSLYLPEIAKEIAAIKGVDYEELLEVTFDNACKMYRIGQKG